MSFSIGSISSGTLRDEDLFPALVDALTELNVKDMDAQRKSRHEALLADCAPYLDTDDEWTDEQREQVAYLINENLFDALNEHCPDFVSFGAHPGDGADFGFWPDMDAAAQAVDDGELLGVSDLSEVPAGFSGLVYHVNDHGNCALYLVDNGKFEELWTCV